MVRYKYYFLKDIFHLSKTKLLEDCQWKGFIKKLKLNCIFMNSELIIDEFFILGRATKTLARRIQI